MSAASGRGCFALRGGELSGSAYSGGHCVAPGDGELRVSASPGPERDALCDAVVAAEAGSRNRKSVSSDCDFDSRSSSLCAVTSRPRGVGCARMNSFLDTHAARVNSQGVCTVHEGIQEGHINSYRVRIIHAVEFGKEQSR